MNLRTLVIVPSFTLIVSLALQAAARAADAGPPRIPEARGETAAAADAMYRRLFDLIDLTKPNMTALREKVAAGNLAAAMLEYRAILAARVAKLPKWTRFGYSLWQPANADDLLAGNATTARYGDTSIHYTAHIGKPGEINFFATTPEYPDIGRDISNMEWVNKYAEAYVKTRDPKYLAGWCATWADFTDHWPDQWQAVRKNKEIRVSGLGWITGPLMTGMRLYTMEAGFTGILQTASAAGHLDQVDPRALAGFLVRVATSEMGYALPWLKRAGGNQVRILASGVLNWGILLPEMKDSKKWRENAVPANISTCLPDGSDQEQSLNYFNNGIAPLVNLLRKRLPPEEQDPALLARVEAMSAYRGRVISSLARPDGFVPGTGTDPVWDKYGKTAKLNPPSTAFTSILLPYGGYAVQRDGWKADSLYLFMKQTRPNWGHWRPIDGALQLSAYGRNLLVSPMGQVYDKRDSTGGWTIYWGSAVSQNAIVVDGMSSAEKRGDFSKLDPWRWHTSARYDFMETEVTGPYRGNDFRTDGMTYQERKKGGQLPKREPVTDVAHRRQVHFLREAGCWVVTDRVHCAQPHDFTQSWCVGPEFAEKEVEINPAGKSIRTRQASGPNLSLYQFGISGLQYARYYGVRDDNHVLGWVGIMPDREKWVYTPAVAVHANWRGQGDWVLVTLVSPRRGAPERISGVTDKCGEGVSGFDAILPDGRPVAYRAAVDHAPLDAGGLKADAGSLLMVRNADGRLTGVALGARTFGGKPAGQPDFEFEIPGPGQPPKTTAITVPTGFQWGGQGKRMVPGYTAPPPP